MFSWFCTLSQPCIHYSFNIFVFLVDSLKELVLSPSPLNFGGSSVWAYTPTPQNGKTTPVGQNLLLNKRPLVENGTRDEVDASKTFTAPLQATPKICTVEELEKSLIKTNVSAPPPLAPHAAPSNNVRPPLPPGYRMVPPAGNQAQPYYGPSLFPRPPPSFQGHSHPYPMGPNRFPPGFPPPNMAPPMRHMAYGPRYRPMAPPHPFLKGGNMQQRPPPGLPFPNHVSIFVFLW